MATSDQQTTIATPKLTKQLPATSTTIATLVIIFLLYAFISGETFKFYASALFLFYGLVNQMWIAVVMLGVFQTILMIPLRLMNLSQTANLKEFEDKVKEIKDSKQQRIIIKKSLKRGDPTILWYTVNFFIQTISYLSMGRLFLIDFYSKPLAPDLLYSFVKYPSYPILGTFFKIPYVSFPQTKDLGIGRVLMVWAIILLIKFILGRVIARAKKATGGRPLKGALSGFSWELLKTLNGSLTVIFVLSWFIIRNFPQSFALSIFSGDVGRVNYTFNAITAFGAFLIVMWLNLSKITKKGEAARASKVPEDIIDKTQSDMFKDSLRSAGVIGLGAYFITRQIPSAFELSIFTLEIISFLSPFTIDRLVLNRRSISKRLASTTKTITGT